MQNVHSPTVLHYNAHWKWVVSEWHCLTSQRNQHMYHTFTDLNQSLRVKCVWTCIKKHEQRPNSDFIIGIGYSRAMGVYAIQQSRVLCRCYWNALPASMVIESGVTIGSASMSICPSSNILPCFIESYSVYSTDLSANIVINDPNVCAV